ncbi:MAG: hypothetical protein H7A23_22250 [Leptospiraceae bacterium]|nr:hypothetical protein [Leptospiraceae bacterium]MCP5497284.1 hypothetical protein [Leptospiraceae bacterium]
MTNDAVQETRKLSAILFSDIQGYSRLMQNDEGQTLELLKEHNQLIFPIIEKNGGTIIKTIGDAILAVFDSCYSAMQSAISIQESLDEFAKTNPNTLRVRIGLHIGEVVYREGDVFGNGVNIAARLQPLSDPGGICISQAVYEQIKSYFGNKLVRVGPVTLKNISEPVVIYRMQVEGTTEDLESLQIPLAQTPLQAAFVEKQPSYAGTNEITSSEEPKQIFALFSSVTRKRKWFPSQFLNILCIFASVELDFREAILQTSTTNINSLAIFGSVEITIPPNFNVVVDGNGIFGNFEGDSWQSGSSQNPTLHIKGLAVFGSVEVKVPHST